MLDDMVPIVGIVVTIGLPMVIALVAILAKHQRKMAELLHGSQRDAQPLMQEIRALRQEVAELKTRTEALLFQSSTPPLESGPDPAGETGEQNPIR
ncbi:MAG: hypothetical protein IH851_06385 [Armatimonadetes bacterium]|nr:hypothetical protein [Armatimonadota bacterium]